MSPGISAAFTSRWYCSYSPLNFSSRISSSTFILTQIEAIPITRAINAHLANGDSRSHKRDEDTGVHRDIPSHSSRLMLVDINNYISDVRRLI